MNQSSTLYITFLFSISIFIGSGCNLESSKASSETQAHDRLGEIDIQITCSQEAMGHFKKGLLLLHSFEYDDARVSFEQAQALDKECAMAYWGEAMTHNHTLWQRQDTELAKTALSKLDTTESLRLKHLKTDFEKDLFQSIEILYGEGVKYERDLKYKDYLENLTRKYPGNHEISAFYAVSLLGSSRNGRDEELYGKSAKIAQSILDENPSHPGALHYLIHSFDDPDHAHLAVSAADNYSKVAPDAAHALHMPSHIYVALGRWNDVVNSNIASWNASIKKLPSEEASLKPGSYHAFNWLQYGLLQREEHQLAQNLLDRMIKYCAEDSSKVARSYLVAMLGAHLVENNDFSNAYAELSIHVEDLPIVKRSAYSFIKGMHAYENGNLALLTDLNEQLSKEIYNESLNVGEKGFAMCSAGGFANKPPSELDINMSKIMLHQLDARVKLLEGDSEAALNILRNASSIDDSLSYSYGPPSILKPIHEDLAQVLVQNGLYAEAFKAYSKSLERNPRRMISLKGMEILARKLKDHEAEQKLALEIKKSLSPKNRSDIL